MKSVKILVEYEPGDEVTVRGDEEEWVYMVLAYEVGFSDVIRYLIQSGAEEPIYMYGIQLKPHKSEI